MNPAHATTSTRETSTMQFTPRESCDLEVAETLLSALRVLNRVDPDNLTGASQFYATDNSYRVREQGAEPSPYVHVQAALLQSLTMLSGGDPERARDLLMQCHDNGEDVAYNLTWMRTHDWKVPDTNPLTALYEVANEEESEFLGKLTDRAGLTYVCNCGARNNEGDDCSTCGPC